MEKELKFEILAVDKSVLVKINGETLLRINPQEMNNVKVFKDCWLQDNETRKDPLSISEGVIFSVKETKFPDTSNLWDDVDILLEPDSVGISIVEHANGLASPASDIIYMIEFGEGGTVIINPIKLVKSVKLNNKSNVSSIELVEERE
jgi:hypothetical protein